MNKYFGGFDSLESVLREFNAYGAAIFPTEDELIIADYWTGSYEGQAHVFFSRDGKIYEVDAGHCSCYGLEDSWNPQEVVPDQLRMRPDSNGYDWSPGAWERFRELWPAIQTN